MKATGILISAAVLMAFPATGEALPAPKPTKHYADNYKTLANDQKASPQIARCIATGYDYAVVEKESDRLGFTQEDIDAAKTDATTVFVSGEARQRKSLNWIDITLRCVEEGGMVREFEIAPK